MKLMICFHDNDFGNTFRGVLVTLVSALVWDKRIELFTKEQWLSVINEISFGSYILWQNGFRYKNSEDHYEHIREYLKISEKDLLMNEEVDSFMAENGEWQNGESFVLDLELWKSSEGREGIYIL